MSQHPTLSYVAVLIGGACGSLLRHSVNQIAATLFGPRFPWGTLAVNISGALVLGILTGWFAFRGHGGQLTQVFLTTGLVGGFTTFSAFALETALFWERGEHRVAVLYSVGSVIVGVVGVFVGMGIMRHLLAK